MTKLISPAVLSLIRKIRTRLLDPRNHEGDRAAALHALDRLMATHAIDQFDIDAALLKSSAGRRTLASTAS